MQSGGDENVGTTQPAAEETAEPTQTSGRQKAKTINMAKLERKGREGEKLWVQINNMGAYLPIQNAKCKFAVW